jgi:hypothetical protein
MIPGLGKTVSAQHDVSVSIDALEAVENAIKRFGQVGIAIRRSPSTRQSAKIRQYAGSIDSADFEKLAHTALKILYPDATHGLLDHLASSMTETYIVFHRLASRNKHAQTSQRIPAKGLAAMSEEPAKALAAISEEPADGSVMVDNPTTGSRPAFQHRQEAGVGRSEPTTVDSQEFKSYMRRFNSSATRKTKSILAKRADYPRPSGRGETCDWCFQPFPNGLPQGEQWQ